MKILTGLVTGIASLGALTLNSVPAAARPGRIRELIPIDLPRPRDITSPRFNDIKRHILNLLRPQRAEAAPVSME
jgi:NitT/TauT family transport system ATP-binding protein